MSHSFAAALAAAYGPEADLPTHEERVRRALAAFRDRFGPGAVAVYRAPGRVNLIGEHTDYNHGYVLPMSLDRDVLWLARARDDALVNLMNLEADFGIRCFALADDISTAPRGDWANYAQGAAQLLARQFGPGLNGCDALVDGAPPPGIPRGAGLSSSSALTVAAAAALAGLNGLDLAGATLASFCSRAEWYVGTRGGIMDHFAAVLGRPGHALFLDCRPGPDGTYHWQPVPLPHDYDILVVDSGLRHRNTGPLYNRRVAEVRAGVQLLARRYPGITHLRDVEDVAWEEIAPLLPEEASGDDLRAAGIAPERLLDGGAPAETERYQIRRRCRHVWRENHRVLAAVEALATGDVDRLGRLMAEAHASARDDYEISTPEIDALVGAAESATGGAGARLTGAGWGGCIVALVERRTAEAAAEAIVAAYARDTGRVAEVFACRSGAGAGLLLRTKV